METNYINFKKSDDTQSVRWLQNGVSSDSLLRPALKGIRVEGNLSVATDGFHLRATDTPELLKAFDGKTIKLSKAPRANGDLIEFETVEGKFPEWRNIKPTEKSVFTIVVDGNKLANILSGMGPVQLKFYNETKPMEIRSEDKYALLMPMLEMTEVYSIDKPGESE